MKHFVTIIIIFLSGFTTVFSQNVESQQPTVNVVQISELGGVINKSTQIITISESRARASDKNAENTQTRRDTTQYPDPNLTPYRTRRTVFSHALALPSTLWNAAWYPVGQFTIWMEQKHVHQRLINFFFNKAHTGAIFPVISFGGNTGVAGGVIAFHNNLFNRQKLVNFTFLYGSSDDNSAILTYTDPAIWGSPAILKLTAEYFNDSDENHFIGGNFSGVSDRSSYAITRRNTQLDLGFPLSSAIAWDISAKFEHFDIEPSNESRFGERFPTDIPGIGTNNLGSIGTILTFDFRNGWPRTLSGALLKIGYDFNSEFSDAQFQFHHYFGEIQTFVSLPFLARNRRFSARARLDKAENVAGKDIPFYALSMLGDENTLRGFDQNRFRDKGSLMFNFEYRYPIYDTFDAVIFWDEGQVFDEFEQLRLDRFHWGAGFGLRFMTTTGFLFRLEFGFSNEKTPRALLGLTPNF